MDIKYSLEGQTKSRMSAPSGSRAVLSHTWAGDSCCSLGCGEPWPSILTRYTHNQDPLDSDWPSVFFPGHCRPASDFRSISHVSFSSGDHSLAEERKLGLPHQQVSNFKGQRKIVLNAEFGKRAMTAGQGVIKKGLVE